MLPFIRIDAAQHLFSKRWLLPFPVILMTAYVFSGDILTQSATHALDVNAWDALFSIFDNANNVFYFLTPFYLYLVCDLLPESTFSEAVLLRLRSRGRWWAGKAATLGMAVCMYLFMLVATVAVVASFVLPWSSQWRTKTVQDSITIGLAPTVLTVSPAVTFAHLVLLLALGWFGLGLTVLVCIQLLKAAKWGFIAGFFVNLSGLVAHLVELPAPYNRLFINNHLLFSYHAFGDRTSPYPTLTTSFTYWTVWILTMLIVGWGLSVRYDFLRSG